MQDNFEPPKELIQNNKKLTFIESKTTNSKGERLSEVCYWYEGCGMREPLSRGNVEVLKKPLK